MVLKPGIQSADLRPMFPSKPNHPSNARFCALVEASGLTQAVALTIFNRGLSKPVTESTFKSWMKEPDSNLWAEIPGGYLERAEAVFGVQA